MTCIERLLGLQAGAWVCDAACGWGRLAVPLAARQRYRMLGIDQSEFLINNAKRDAHATGVSAHFLCADLRDLRGDGSFHGAYLFGTSLGYYDDDSENAAVIGAIRSLMRKAAVLVFSQVNRPTNLDVNEDDGEYLFEKRSTFDALTGLYVGCYRYTHRTDGEVRCTPFRIRLYSFPEMQRVFASSGFRDIRSFGGFDFRPFEPESPMLITRCVV